MITEYVKNDKNNINNKTLNQKNCSNNSVDQYSLTSKKTKKHKNIFKKKLSSKINYTINQTKKKSILPPIRTDLQILKEIESRKPKNLGSIFIFDKPQKRKKIQSLNHVNHHINENEKYDIKKIKNYNVFSMEDNEIRDLMIQFERSNKNKLMPKKKRRRKILDKLYGLTPELKHKLDNAKSNKKLNLKTYQENILYSLDDEYMDVSDIMDLMQSFDDLKIQDSSVMPLPPINLDIIYNHVYNKSENKNKSMNSKDYFNKNNNENGLDEFEKEQKLINNIKSYKFVPKKRRNKNLEKMPLFIREVFTKQYH